MRPVWSAQACLRFHEASLLAAWQKAIDFDTRLTVGEFVGRAGDSCPLRLTGKCEASFAGESGSKLPQSTGEHASHNVNSQI